jgi:hypothetical protein
MNIASILRHVYFFRTIKQLSIHPVMFFNNLIGCVFCHLIFLLVLLPISAIAGTVEILFYFRSQLI